MYLIKEMPKQERPRERFLKFGASSLSTHELLAIIIRTGSKNESVIDLSKHLLYKYHSLKELSTIQTNELMKMKGIGTSKAIELQTVFEIAKRINSEQFKEGVFLKSPESIFLYTKDQLEMKTQEHLLGLYLNTKGELIKKEVLFIGSLNTSLIHPREVFKFAVQYSAATLILIHNHPSGDPTPSSNDIDVTKRMVRNGEMMDIPVMDHVIIGRDKYYSFKEHGII